MNEKGRRPNLSETRHITAEIPHLAELLNRREDWELAIVIAALSDEDYSLTRQQLHRLLSAVDQDDRAGQ